MINTTHSFHEVDSIECDIQQLTSGTFAITLSVYSGNVRTIINIFTDQEKIIDIFEKISNSAAR